MRRRQFLRAAAALGGLSGPVASALPAAGHDADQPRSSENRSSDSTVGATATDGFGPLGHVELRDESVRFEATEAVTTPEGRYAFVAVSDGFVVVDLADPASPQVVATREDIPSPDIGTIGSLKDLAYDRERVLVASDRGDGIAVFDVSDPTDPQLTRSYGTGYAVHNADLSGDYAYLTTGTALEIVDVSTDSPSPAGDDRPTWSVIDYDDAYADVDPNLRNLHDIYVQDGRAYLAYWDAGTWILDVSDPAAPAHLGHVADYTAEELAAIPDSDVGEAFLEPPGNSHYARPNDDGTLLAVGVESWDAEGSRIETDEPEDEDRGGPGSIHLWDIADPAEPSALATIDPPQPPAGETTRRNGGFYTTAHNFDIVGNVLYSSWYRGGVKVHDISDPATPVELAHWADGATTSFWTAHSAVPGDFFVAASHGDLPDSSVAGGLYTFPDPTDADPAPTPSATATPTANATPTPTATQASPAPSETTTPTGPATDSVARSPGTTTGDGGPGLGIGSALAGLGAGAWWLAGRRDGDDCE